MAKSSAPADRPAPVSRFRLLLIGAALGAGWGSLMWAIIALTGEGSGVRGWLYIAVTTAMIGAGVAAIFGAGMVRRRGERVTPQVPSPRRRRGR
ncbi:MAG: hypothetical protein AB7V42_06025 [Thermoleophilia bacterium]